MNAGTERRLVVVWVVLSVITVAQLGIGSLDGPNELRPDAVLTSSAILIALVKVRIILREFMEVRHAPALLCRLTDLWVLVTGVSLLGCYFAGRVFATG